LGEVVAGMYMEVRSGGVRENKGAVSSTLGGEREKKWKRNEILTWQYMWAENDSVHRA
jgi:hypothetical protein